MPPSKQKFQEGEKVLCYHGPLMYEAKCNKVDLGEKQIKYFMHYAGWNKSWDEWVNEDRIMKFNEAGLQRQKELKVAHANKRRSAPTVKKEKEPGKEREKDKDKEKDRERDKDKKDKDKKEKDKKEKLPDKEKKDKKEKDKKEPKESRKHRASSDAGSEPPRKTRARDALLSGDSDDTESTKGEMKIEIPEELKTILKDDWDLITRQNSLYHLPARKTVQAILDEYVDFKLRSSKEAFVRDMAEELALAVRDYFNTILATQLLYKNERPQYQDFKAEPSKKPASDVYGAVHLLRVFVKLGGLISYSNLDEKSWFFLASHIQDLLRYILKQRAGMFSKDDYVPASPEYLRRTV